MPVTGNQLDASGRIVPIALHSAAAGAGLRIGDRIDRKEFLSRSTEFMVTRGTGRLTATATGTLNHPVNEVWNRRRH